MDGEQKDAERGAMLVEVREVLKLALAAGLSFADCCAAALEASREVELEGAAQTFSAGPGLENKALRAVELRRLALLVANGEVSALVLGYRVEIDEAALLTLVEADARVGVSACEELVDALAERFKEGC